MTEPRPLTALYPGSFDPVTLGHEDVAQRTLRVADQVLVAVSESSAETKSPVFNLADRLQMLEEVFEGEERIKCVSFQGLLVNFARERGADIVVRGLRAFSDFEYEFQLAQMNRELYPNLEFIYLMPDTKLSFLSSSLVREVARLGGDVSSFVSAPVHRRLATRFSPS
jgi:pantetheine-phosphate adenylyltransferase